MNERTPYQNGYEDAQDRGLFASGLPKHGEIGEYRRGYHDGEEALKKQLPSSRISALEAQVKALTAERDEAFATIAEHNLCETLGMIPTLQTALKVAQDLIDEITKERDAQAEAVRVLGEICRMAADDSPDHDRDFLAWMVEKITNPIARATVEGGKQ